MKTFTFPFQRIADRVGIWHSARARPRSARRIRHGAYMAAVRLESVRKVYPNGQVAVAGATFDAADGELLVLVGPSGCGKSTLLRMIAGLESVTSGTLAIGERIVNDVPPRDRDIAMVFQNYALYPHMSVAENLAFGLNLRKHAARRDRRARARSGGDARSRARARSPARGAFGRPAPARRARARARAQAFGVFARRAAVESRREAAGSACAWRSPSCTSASARR